MMTIRVLVLLFACSLCSAATTSAQEPRWSGKVVTFGTEHQQIKQTHILLRPYRPFHFYGNTVRRMHYRGTALPNLQDLLDSSAALFGSRPEAPSVWTFGDAPGYVTQW